MSSLEVRVMWQFQFYCFSSIDTISSPQSLLSWLPCSTQSVRFIMIKLFFYNFLRKNYPTIDEYLRVKKRCDVHGSPYATEE